MTSSASSVPPAPSASSAQSAETALANKTAAALRKPIIREPQVVALLFLIPALFIFLVFVCWPIIQTLRYSMVAWDGIKPIAESANIGLQNYETLLKDPIFWKALGN